jgi:uncharacterized membrane protein YraQ (UPF0718 family)
MNELIDIAAVFVVRLLQALLLSLPTLLAGLLVAGAIVTFVGRDRVVRWLGDDSIGALLRAWLLGIVLPVCAIGVIPLLLVLRRLGAGRGALVVIALSGPMVTPWTLGYFLDRAGLGTGLALLAIQLAIAFSAGWLARERVARVLAIDDTRTGPRSPLLSMILHASRALDGRAMVLIAIGLVGVGTLATLLPANVIGEWLVEREPMHALLISAVPLLSYITPAAGAMQVGEAFNASMMPGLAVPLIVIGSAVHLGTIVLMIAALRARAVVIALGVVLVAGAGAGLIEAAHYDPDAAPDDTHAFEDYGRPFHLLDHPDGALGGFVHRLQQPLHAGTLPAGLGVLALLTLGRIIPTAPIPAPVMPTRALRVGAIAAAGLTLVLTVYGYYPPPRAIAAELRVLSAEFTAALRTANVAEARHVSRQIDRRIGQIEVSFLLRGQPAAAATKGAAVLQGQATALAVQADQPDQTANALQYAESLMLLVRTLDADTAR